MQTLAERIPHLQTAQCRPLHELERLLLRHQVTIEAWLRQQWRQTPAPVYSSVDLRNAGFKLAPVDTNLFPAGFNNLNPDFLSLAIQAAQATFERLFPGCLRILIIPESHTRNRFYLESLAVLQDILLKAGFDVRLGSLSEEITQAKEITLPSGRSVLLEPIQRQGNRIGVEAFKACIVLLNNDLSSGIPAVLQGLEQPILPPLTLGWSNRFKSQHFQHYAEISEEFAKLLAIDPWLINPLFRRCTHVDFMKREGEICLMQHTADLLQAIEKKYREYAIEHKPYVVIKADAGTYGMGVLTVQSPEEIRDLNRRKRTHMSTAKGNRPINQVILQEGVYTFETWQEAVAEPVAYLFGCHVIGGFYRVHKERGVNENLNSPGMHFVPLAFAEACNIPQVYDVEAYANRFYSYGVIARLAALAAAREQKALEEIKA